MQVEAGFTRLSLGTQLRQELERLEGSGRIAGWKFAGGGELEGIRYEVKQPSGEVFVMSPGDAADWLNGKHGCDVRIGKRPS
jgi:hypothetical protein